MKMMLPVLLLAACSSHRSEDVRWVSPSQAGPHGQAPGAKARVIAASPDGVKHYVIVLRRGDEILTALSDFANREHIVNAHFVAIGGVDDAELGWFDPKRNQFKAMTRREPMEVLTMSGDIALASDGTPSVHAHLALARSDGSAWGGHLFHATTSPTFELYLTSFPEPLHKVPDAETGLQLLDPSVR